MQWESLSKSAVPSVKTLQSFGLGAAKSVSNLISFEIVRDFWQVISLFFEGLGNSLPASFRAFFGRFAVAWSFCFSCWFQANREVISIIIYVIEVIVALIAMGMFLCRKADPDAKSQGLEVQTWETRSKSEKKKLYYLIIVITTLYLPVFRDSVHIFSCDLKFISESESCDGGLRWGLVFVGVIAISCYIILAPYKFLQLITENKPKPSLFDAEGQERVGGYTLADYKSDLAKDSGPYKVLYDGYEPEWANYKVLVMLIKCLLVLPVILFTNNNSVGARDPNSVNKQLLLIQSIWTIIVLTAYTILSSKTAPFIKETDDRLDQISRITALTVAVLGCLASQISSNAAAAAFGVLLNVILAFGGFLGFCYFISGNDKARTVWKVISQRCDLTKTRDTEEVYIFSSQLNLAKDRKLRIWHTFWNTVFRQDPQYRMKWDPDGLESAKKKTAKENKCNVDDVNENEISPDLFQGKSLSFQYGGTPPFLLNFDGTIEERHEENKEIIENESFTSFESFLQLFVTQGDDALEKLKKCMKACMREIQGVDAYWSGPVQGDQSVNYEEAEECKHEDNNSKTKFGKLYCVPVPFCAVWISDESDDIAVFSAAEIVAGKKYNSDEGKQKIMQLVDENNNPETVRRKNVRLQCRGLEGKLCLWPIKRTKPKSISRQVPDGNGGTKRERKTVMVEFSFTNGTFNIGRDSATATWTAPDGQTVDITKGFNLSLQYSDGVGSHHESGWGDHNWNNEPLTLAPIDFGLNDEYVESPKWQEFCQKNYAQSEEDKKQAIMQSFKNYTNDVQNRFVKHETTLSYAFWYYIFNNDHLEKDEIEALLKVETNELIHDFCNVHDNDLKIVFDVLKFFDTDGKHSFWWLFWHDLWINNQSLKLFQENEDLLSPYRPKSLCYNIEMMHESQKDTLIEKLKEHKLCGKESKIRHGWINLGLIDKLYEKMASCGSAAGGDGDEIRIEVQEQSEKATSTTKLLGGEASSFENEYQITSKIVRQLCEEQQ